MKNEEMKLTKTDEKILAYLTPTTDKQLLKYGHDTYFCGCSKHLKNEYKESCIEKVKAWVEKNGGRFEIKSAWLIQRVWNGNFYSDNAGKIVQIIFPCYNKRNMKEIMATLFSQKKLV